MRPASARPRHGRPPRRARAACSDRLTVRKRSPADIRAGHHPHDAEADATPSCGETGGRLGDLYDDVVACRRAIADTDGPVVLCGHSYGGVVITEAGADDRVSQLLYVTSVMPEAGQSQADLVGSEPAPWLDPSDDGTVGVHAQEIRDLFLGDCDAATTEQAVARLTRQSLTPLTQAPREIAWQLKPSSYLVCTKDLATPADVQRRSIRAGTRSVDFEAGGPGDGRRPTR